MKKLLLAVLLLATAFAGQAMAAGGDDDQDTADFVAMTAYYVDKCPTPNATYRATLNNFVSVMTLAFKDQRTLNLSRLKIYGEVEVSGLQLWCEVGGKYMDGLVAQMQ